MVVIALNRNAGNAVGEAIVINVEVFLRFFVFLLCFLFVLLFWLFVFGLGAIRCGRLVAFLADGDFVAFRWKRILYVFAKRKSKDAVAAIGGVVELDLAERRLKVMVGSVVEIVAVRASRPGCRC